MGGALVRLVTSLLSTCLAWAFAAWLAAWALGVTVSEAQTLWWAFSTYGWESASRLALTDIRVVSALLIGAASVLAFQLVLLNLSVALLVKTDGDLQRLEAAPRL